MGFSKKSYLPVTIKNKFILLSTLISFIPIITIAFFSYINYNSYINIKLSESMSNLVSVVNWNINTIIIDVKAMSNVIISSRDVQYALSNNNFSHLENMENKKGISEVLASVAISKEYINTILLFNRDISLVQGEMPRTSDIESLTSDNPYYYYVQQPWYYKIQENDGRGIWFDGNQFTVSPNNILMYGRVINNMNTLSPLGTLVIGVDKIVFENMLENLRKNNNFHIIIFSSEDIIYASSPQIYKAITKNPGVFDDISEKNVPISITSDEKYLISFATNPLTGWKIVCAVEYKEILGTSDRIRNLTILIALLSMFVAISGAFLITNKIIGQLKLLKFAINKLKDNQPLDNITFDVTDEAGQIGNEFFRVVKENKELNANLYEAIIKQKEAELLALQSQINPHFLYNTLNSIFWMAQKIKAYDISKMVINLSKIFKLTLNSGEQLTTVKNEIEQITCYLEIQKIRYQNKFDVQIDINKNILECRIPKLLVQPLVENAIYHGIEPKYGHGNINIIGFQEQENLIFTIKDDGVGFKADEVLASRKGYALKNIEERIKLYYGSDYGISFISNPNMGTQVTIRIRKTGTCP